MNSNKFYVNSLKLLNENNINFLLGGAHALQFYTGVQRDTKDLDIFCLESDYSTITHIFQENGYDVQLADERWMGKIFHQNYFIDLIYNSYNSLNPVVNNWFDDAQNKKLLGIDIKIPSAEADILCLCGDLTDHGYPDEAVTLVEYMQDFDIPVVAVLGNHDHDHDLQDEILEEGDIRMLQGSTFIHNKIGFAGVKGFAGGFGKYAMPMFGEALNKKFVQASVDEALLLDQAMISFQRNEQVEKIVAVLHYSPIAETVQGEPEQIFPF